MSTQATFWDMPSAIGSLAEDFGPSRSGKPAGPTSAKSGREAAPAHPLAQRAKGRGLQILVTSGRNGHGSSASAALQQSLESRLLPRLDMAGSTLFLETWKRKATPLRRRYWEHTASARRTSGSGFTSLPSPNANEPGGELRMKADRPGRLAENPGDWRQQLGRTAGLASCPTPMAGSPATETCNAAGNTDYSRKIVELATVATPKAEDAECAGAHRGTPDTLHSQANLSAVATPAVGDSLGGGSQTAAARKAAGLTRPSGATYGTVLRHEVMLANLATPAALLSNVRTPTACTPNALRGRGQDPMKRMKQGHAVNLQDEVTLYESGVGPDGSTRSGLDQLPRQAQLADGGPTAIGGTAETASGGQLDPAYSRWLMGVPPEWDAFACTAMQSVSRRRKRSSKRT